MSGLIFVALALAWAVYLVPQALRHHDEVARSRSVDRFSDTMRVLARREPVGRRGARLVVQPGRQPSAAEVTVKGAPRPTPAQLQARREATRRATARRRNVLGILLLGNAVVAGLAAAGILGWVWQAIPAGLVVVWLVLCRVMVRSERAALAPAPTMPLTSAPDAEEAPEAPASYAVERNHQGFDEVTAGADTATLPAVAPDEQLWDPLPVTLPTYVTKPAAVSRSVRTIDLGEPGAWTSGRTEESAALAREADAADRAARGDDESRRAVGS